MHYVAGSDAAGSHAAGASQVRAGASPEQQRQIESQARMIKELEAELTALRSDKMKLATALQATDADLKVAKKEIKRAQDEGTFGVSESQDS